MIDFNLTVIWACIIAFSVAAYVVMDGFDLGIGILFPGFKVGGERDMAMNSIAPVWDGNETWLVLGGGGLMAAFPLAYAIILPALYAPLTAMLLGLVFRGVAFEFRWRDPDHRRLWDFGFCAGSLLATFAQGVTLGALLQGVTVVGRAYGGGWWEWLTPFSLLTGFSLIIGYALLGSSWLIWENAWRASGRRTALRAAPDGGASHRHCSGQRLHAFPRRQILRAMVRVARRSCRRANAADRSDRRVSSMALHWRQARRRSLSFHAFASSVFQWPVWPFPCGPT